jgi:hypothetical protein
MMLESVALCVVLFDWEAVRLSYLPEKLQEEWTSELGLDVEDVDLSGPLGVAADGDARAALSAVHNAEIQMFKMSGDETRSEVLSCARRYGFLAR